MDFVETIAVRRIRKGEWVEALIRFSYHIESKTLEIAYEWRKRKEVYAEIDLYRVEPIAVSKDFVGSGYLLHRSDKAIAADSEGVKRYETLVGNSDKDDICSCRGHYGNERCKHADALRWLGAKLASAGCAKCGQTDCVLVDGYCSDCEDQRTKTEPATVTATDMLDVPF